MSGQVLYHPAARRPRKAAGSGWLAWLAAALRTIESRRYLEEMDDRMLRDIGLTRGAAIEEARRAPWDLAPPEDRLR